MNRLSFFFVWPVATLYSGSRVEEFGLLDITHDLRSITSPGSLRSALRGVPRGAKPPGQIEGPKDSWACVKRSPGLSAMCAQLHEARVNTRNSQAEFHHQTSAG